MARRIFIHAGQHKTGTTSIQHYIDTHSSVLQTFGITPFRDLTPDLSGEGKGPLPCNVKMIANAVIRPSLLTPMRLSRAAQPLDGEAWAARLPALRRALGAIPTESVLLSAEAFAFLRTPEERERLDQLCEGFEVQPVLFLRAPSAWLESWKVQVEHAGYAAMPGAVAGEGILDLSPQSWLVDHDAMTRFWGAACRVLSYEDAMARHGSVIPAFLTALGLDPARCPPSTDVFLNTGTKKRQQMAGPPP